MSCGRCGALSSGDSNWYPCTFGVEEVQICHRCFLQLELWMAQPKLLTTKQYLADIEVHAINLLEDVKRMQAFMKKEAHQ